MRLETRQVTLVVHSVAFFGRPQTVLKMVHTPIYGTFND